MNYEKTVIAYKIKEDAFPRLGWVRPGDHRGFYVTASKLSDLRSFAFSVNTDTAHTWGKKDMEKTTVVCKEGLDRW